MYLLGDLEVALRENGIRLRETVEYEEDFW
jgi:hypothetical protein